MRLLLALLSLIATPAASQGLVSFPEPTRTGPGAVCVTAPPVRVCREATDDGGHVVVSHGGREAVQWSTSAPGVFDDLRVFRLDNDLLVVAVLDAVSNGLAISTWTLTVTDGQRVLYSFIARDFDPEGGSFGTWSRSDRLSRLVLWATEWHDSEDPRGRRGPGYYLIGRPFLFGPNGLVPVAELPIRARRLLHSFQRGSGGPVAWLSDSRAETRRRDPFWAGRPGGTPGVIASVDLANSMVTVRAGDQDIEVRLDSWSVGVGTGRFGDGASGRLYPPDYVASALGGRSVRLGLGPRESVILWLVAP